MKASRCWGESEVLAHRSPLRAWWDTCQPAPAWARNLRPLELPGAVRASRCWSGWGHLGTFWEPGAEEAAWSCRGQLRPLSNLGLLELVDSQVCWEPVRREPLRAWSCWSHLEPGEVPGATGAGRHWGSPGIWICGSLPIIQDHRNCLWPWEATGVLGAGRHWVETGPCVPRSLQGALPYKLPGGANQPREVPGTKVR